MTLVKKLLPHNQYFVILFSSSTLTATVLDQLSALRLFWDEVSKQTKKHSVLVILPLLSLCAVLLFVIVYKIAKMLKQMFNIWFCAAADRAVARLKI